MSVQYKYDMANPSKCLNYWVEAQYYIDTPPPNKIYVFYSFICYSLLFFLIHPNCFEAIDHRRVWLLFNIMKLHWDFALSDQSAKKYAWKTQQQCLIPEIMTWLLERIHRFSCQQFHVGTMKYPFFDLGADCPFKQKNNFTVYCSNVIVVSKL